ncbi:MAG: response regulator [Chitinivibrionales bacterium]|nr:response regulator [Chitinivibrionales bacterium]MBD3397212.1 response regulator [Chitinivibrionales bacterium]
MLREIRRVRYGHPRPIVIVYDGFPSGQTRAMNEFVLANYYHLVAIGTASYCIAFIAFLSGRYQFSRPSRAFALFVGSVFLWAVKDSLTAMLVPYLDEDTLLRASVILSPLYLCVLCFAFRMLVSVYNATVPPDRQFGREPLVQGILAGILGITYVISLVNPHFMYAQFTKGIYDYSYEPGIGFAVLGLGVVCTSLVPALYLLVRSRANPRSEAFMIPLGGLLSIATIIPSNLLAMDLGIPHLPRLGALSVSIMCAFAFYGIKRYGITFSVRQVLEERNELQMIGESLTRLVSSPDEKQICQSVCDYAQEISNSVYVCIVVFNEEYTGYEIRGAAYSTQALKDTVFSRLPLAVGTKYPVDNDSVFARQILDNQYYACDTIQEFFSDQFDPSLLAQLNATGRIRQVISYPIVMDNMLKGSVVLFRPTPVRNVALYRLFAAQCSLALKFSAQIRELEDKRRLEEMLHQSQKMDALGQLAGGVAHDLNNMLAGISGYIDIIRRSFAKDNPKLAGYVKTMANASEKASDLINKLLAFARKGAYQMVPVDVHKVVEEVTQLLGRTIDRRIEISQDLAADPSVVKGDPTQLQNALLNLALNARDAMPRGGHLVFETRAVSVGEDDTRYLEFPVRGGEYVMIAVRDTGLGMDEETLAHMYEPFFTTKDIGKGTGLGLSSVYGCVKNHGGYILAESEPGKGTTFSVYFPVLRDAREAPARESTGMVPLASQPGGEKGHIVVVDDEPIVRQLCATILGDFGYTVTAFADAREAVAFYRAHVREVDLAIVDMIMPHMSGSECFAELLKVNPKVKVILATGYDVSERTQKVLTKGISGFLQKPFKESSLVKMVEEVLSRDTAAAATDMMLRG